MQFLDFDKFKAIDADEFAATQPYPWINPQGLLTDEGYQCLLHNMPDISLFEKKFGYGRIAGQKPHDRYSLEYTSGAPVPSIDTVRVTMGPPLPLNSECLSGKAGDLANIRPGVFKLGGLLG